MKLGVVAAVLLCALACTPEARELPHVPELPALPPSSAADSGDGLDPASAPAAPSAPSWSYAGAEGPEHWHELRSTFAGCAGPKQSPVELPAAAGTPEALAASWQYLPIPMTVVPPRQVVEVPSTAAARVEIAGIRYYLLRIAAHTPSEHRLGKSAAAAEIQLYHRSADEKYFAISLLLEEAKPGETPTHLLDPYFAALSGSSKSGASKPGELDVAALVPPGGPFLEYTGSLTIPPCTADVLWWVLKTPLRVTPAQLSTLRESLTKPNQRPLQPLGDRTVRTLAKP